MELTEQTLRYIRLAKTELTQSLRSAPSPRATSLKTTYARLNKPIIIGGSGSSGSTLLRRMINMHPAIACGSELSLLDRPLLYQLPLAMLKEMYLEQNFEPLELDYLVPVRTAYGTYCGLSILNTLREYHEPYRVVHFLEAAQDSIDFVNIFLSEYAVNQGKTRWAEKTPNNIFCAEQLLEALPDALFVHIIRDGRDVVNSLVEKRGGDPHSAAIRLIKAMNCGLSLREHPRYVEVKYEDLVQAPEETMRVLLQRCEADYDAQVLEFHQDREAKSTHLGYAREPVHTHSLNSWERCPLPRELKLSLELLMRQHLQLLGYLKD